MRKNVIIVGAPRSGTSMTAHVFAKKGYFVAVDPDRELRPGDQFNPTGYWEAQRLIEANVEIFRAAGFTHHNTWLFDAIDDEHRVRIANMEPNEAHRGLVALYDAHSPWMWKDPRLCYTIGYWWPLMNAATTRVLCVRRETQHVANSFQRVGWADGFGEAHNVSDRIAGHVHEAAEILAHRRIPHMLVDYGDFKRRPAELARELGEYCGLQLSPADLGFRGVLDHSGVAGTVVANAERVVASIPLAGRSILKNIASLSALRRLFALGANK